MLNLEWFSEFQKDLGKSYGAIKNDKYRGSDKLVPHLMEHKEYVLHYRNLKYIKELAFKLIMFIGLSVSSNPRGWKYISASTRRNEKSKR